MFQLRTGYFITGIITGLILLFNFLTSLPDGKLHIFFCTVGEGDASYIRFPDGRDMLIDGGPSDTVLGCLSRHMPFYDRTIDLVFLSHPQKDHMQGLVSVFQRYRIGYFVKSNVDGDSDIYRQLLGIVRSKRIPVKFVTRGETITVGPSSLSVIWPSEEQVAQGKPLPARQTSPVTLAGPGNAKDTTQVLGSAAVGDLNEYSLVFFLRYGAFDALFPGDADTHVERYYDSDSLADDTIEVLKVPHHGSKTGMNEDFVRWLRPSLSVISVGKNSYGHPTKEALNLLALNKSQVLRTDQVGDIEVVSDGRGWKVQD